MSSYEEHLAEREAQNGVYATSRLLAKRPDALGLLGERELARFFGLPQDLTNKPGGDCGIDLKVPLVVPVAFDVKATTRIGNHLLVEASKVRPRTIYVLAHVDLEANTGTLIGWEWAEVVKKAPTTDWCNNGVIVHYIHRKHLRDMQELRDRQVQT